MAALTNIAHERFVMNLIAGKSQRNAYIDAYPNSAAWKPSSVDTEASRLFRRDDVRERYNELMGAVSMQGVLTRADKMKILADMATDEELYPKARMQAIDLLNKMDGDYVKKSEVKITSDLSDVSDQVSAILDE